LTVGADVFLDTNVLIYAAQGKAADADRYGVARRILAEENYGTSAQVLAEFFANVTRKGARPLSLELAAKWVRIIARKPCQAVDARVVLSGIEIQRRYAISYWDAAIIAAAERLGSRILYTEDLNHGQLYGPVRVVNPFLDA
jgi:predicted nucleic acid-binding protein